jgi:cellulose synthase/poly-beta-1,6-N-acetylglucosamine synthase-like glycosyltransferase
VGVVNDWMVLGLSLAGLVMLFGFYPMLLKLSPVSSMNELVGPDQWPSLSVVVAVRNGASLIGAKIDNTLALDYPPELLEVVVVSDGSTDETAEILRTCQKDRVSVHLLEGHQGKHAALNHGGVHARGEILMMTDADALLAPDAARSLIRHFKDPMVGGVCGQRVVGDDIAAMKEGQQGYIRADSTLKMLESAHGFLSSNDGKLYALRRNLFKPVAPGVTDDLFVALNVMGQGAKFLFEPLALAVIPVPSRTPGHELTRRRRVTARSLRGIWIQRHLLNPWRYGLLACGLLINKVVRRLLPVLLLALFVASVNLAPASWAVALLLIAQVGFYALALLWPLSSWLQGRYLGLFARMGQLAFYFCVGNVGLVLGWIDLLLGRVAVTWEPRKS